MAKTKQNEETAPEEEQQEETVEDDGAEELTENEKAYLQLMETEQVDDLQSEDDAEEEEQSEQDEQDSEDEQDTEDKQEDQAQEDDPESPEEQGDSEGDEPEGDGAPASDDRQGGQSSDVKTTPKKQGTSPRSEDQWKKRQQEILDDLWAEATKDEDVAEDIKNEPTIRKALLYALQAQAQNFVALERARKREKYEYGMSNVARMDEKFGKDWGDVWESEGFQKWQETQPVYIQRELKKAETNFDDFDSISDIFQRYMNYSGIGEQQETNKVDKPGSKKRPKRENRNPPGPKNRTSDRNETATFDIDESDDVDEIFAHLMADDDDKIPEPSWG